MVQVACLGRLLFFFFLRDCFSVPLLYSTYLPSGQNSGVGADGIN